MNQDKNVCSVGNATDENNGKTEKDSKEYSNGLDGKTVNQDENAHSVSNTTDKNSGKSKTNATDCSNLNTTHEKNGKTEVIEIKGCSNSSDGKTVRESVTKNKPKMTSVKDQIVHCVVHLNGADRNNGKGEDGTKECSKNSEKKTVERQTVIVIDKVSNTTSPNNESVHSVDKLNAADDNIEKDQKKSPKGCFKGSDRQAVKSNAAKQKAQAKDKKPDCSAHSHIQEGTKGNICCLNGKLVVKKCSKASGRNPVMCENSESMHSMGTSEKCNFDPLISGCESVRNMLGDIF